jgi:hypothetical protein
MTGPAPGGGQQAGPLIDTGNQLLAPVNASLDAGTVTQPEGTKLAVITIRTASTTLTVMLDAPSYATWMQVLAGLQNQMGAGIQVVTPDQARFLGLDGRRNPG